MPKDTPSLPMLRVTLGQSSTAGRKASNQDFHGALLPEGAALRLKGITLAIADGISSSEVSAEAAETAVKSLLTDYYATPDTWTVRTAAGRVIAATNAWLHARNGSISDINTGQVTTLSALILKGRDGHILHVGDARVLRLAGASLEPLTQDHRVTLSAQESYLGRALGVGPQVEVDYRRIPLKVGDVFVLATDGVHEHIDASDVTRALEAPDLDAAAMALTQLAYTRGSDDNLTVQILRIDGLPAEDTDALPELADLPVPPLPKPGDILEGFTILRQVQVTARSHVFLARTPEGKRVALKIPAGDLTGDPVALRRFAMEEWVTRRVSSPHVVAGISRSEPSRCLISVSAWVEGMTLRQWMIDNPNPTRAAVRDIIAQITTGLRALHRRQIQHQDLRPENVMINAEGHVTLIDLGAASIAGLQDSAPGLAGALPGTYQYTAPEYLSGDAVSWRSDQYALGVIAYEMLTGRLPYGAEVARIQSRADQRRLRYQSACDDNSGVPDWMDVALRRAVHPDPLRRYNALSEFVHDLRRPGANWQAGRHVPLAKRNPERFWQSVSAGLAVLCFILATR